MRPTLDELRPDDAEREERAVYAIIAVACAPVVVAALGNGTFDGGATLCALVVVACLLAIVFQRSRLPRAVAREPARRARGTPRGGGRDARDAGTREPREGA